MINIYNNKEAFKNIKPFKYFYVLIFIIILLFIIFILMYKTKIYDNYEAKSYVTCEATCNLTVLYPSNITYDFIKFNNKNLEYQKDNEEIVIDENNLISYKKLSLTLNKNYFQDKEIITINFYYHKQRIINKLLKLLF